MPDDPGTVPESKPRAPGHLGVLGRPKPMGLGSQLGKHRADHRLTSFEALVQFALRQLRPVGGRTVHEPAQFLRDRLRYVALGDEICEEGRGVLDPFSYVLEIFDRGTYAFAHWQQDCRDTQGIHGGR